MPLLKKHLCETPDYDPIEVLRGGDKFFNDEVPYYWECELCGRIYHRDYRPDIREIEVELPLEGIALWWAKATGQKQTRTTLESEWINIYSDWRLCDRSDNRILIVNDSGKVEEMKSR